MPTKEGAVMKALQKAKTASEIAKTLDQALRNGKAVIHLRSSNSEITRDVVGVVVRGVIVKVDGKQELIPLESICSIQEAGVADFDGQPKEGRVLFRHKGA